MALGKSLNKEMQNSYRTSRGYLIMERAGGWIDYTFTDTDYYLLEEGRLEDIGQLMENVAASLVSERKLKLTGEVPYETTLTNYIHANID